MAQYLVTGGAGFIGSNLARALLRDGERVRVLDDFSTGRRENLVEIEDQIEVVEGSICHEATLAQAMAGVDYCLHQAAIPSVPRSVEAPLASNQVNVHGTLSVFVAARDAGVRRVVFASSSSIYGRAETMPLGEDLPRAPISPYGVGKATKEMYAEVCTALYGIEIVGLRYFNVFGPRQDPNSAYAAVIPIFVRRMLRGECPPVHGDGLQARDFSYIDNVVQANLLAARKEGPLSGVFNIACGVSTSVLDLVVLLNVILGTSLEAEFEAARAGDIPKSWANIARAGEAFGYAPVVDLQEGLERTVAWLRQEEGLA